MLYLEIISWHYVITNQRSQERQLIWMYGQMSSQSPAIVVQRSHG